MNEESVTLDEASQNVDNSNDTTGTENVNNNQENVNKKPPRRWIPKSKFRRMNKAKLKEQINLINNLSDLNLTDNMKRLLNKGLNFCPSPKNVNITQISADCFHLERNMAWKYVFHSIDPPDDEEHVKTPFDEKRNKINLPKHFPEPISTFTESVRSELIGAQHNKSKQNLTAGEKEALEELDKLQKNGQIVLQPADKYG